MIIIWTPLDGICVNFFEWLEGIADQILDAVEAPEWQPSWFEFGMATPILAINEWLDVMA